MLPGNLQVAIYFDGRGSIRDNIFWGNKSVLGVNSTKPDAMQLDLCDVGGPGSYQLRTGTQLPAGPGEYPRPMSSSCPPRHVRAA